MTSLHTCGGGKLNREELEIELGACREQSRAELGEMEKLLVVARREHSKAVMDVKQLTRQLARDQEKCREVHHLDTQHLQQQLLDTQKKLQTTLVEKNLLLVRETFTVACLVLYGVGVDLGGIGFMGISKWMSLIVAY